MRPFTFARMTQQQSAGFVDFFGQCLRAARIRMIFGYQAPMGGADFRLIGILVNP